MKAFLLLVALVSVLAAMGNDAHARTPAAKKFTVSIEGFAPQFYCDRISEDEPVIGYGCETPKGFYDEITFSTEKTDIVIKENY